MQTFFPIPNQGTLGLLTKVILGNDSDTHYY